MSSLLKTVAIFLSCIVFLGLYGCTRKSNQVDFDINLNSETLELEVGTQKAIEVSIDRKNLAEDIPINLSLEEPHEGFSASDAVLTGSSGSFIISSSKAGTFDLNLKASTDSLSKTIPLGVTVLEAQGFNISATPTKLNLTPSEQGSINLQITRHTIADAVVNVKLKNTSADFIAPEISISGNTGTLKISSAKQGTFDLILLATSSGFSKEVVITLTVTTQPSFLLDAQPTNLLLKAGASSTSFLSIERRNGFAQAVQVQASNLPSGVSASSITIPAGETQGQLVFTATKDTSQGLYPVKITATNDDKTLSDSSEVNLNISKTSTGTTLVKENVATGLKIPWDLTFTPSGTLYFTERSGTIKKVVDGNVINMPHPLNVTTEIEAGLMGLVFDPGYPQEPYLYTCYSYRDASSVIKNRVSRLTVQSDSLSDENIIINTIPGSSNHDGCRLIFGPDNKLYITMGDARVGGNAQDTNSLSGKTLRINKDGSIPSDNPFGNAVWSYGHRNAQGLAFHSNGRLFSSEHGDASEDEVNRIVKGGNYGWPFIEGRCNTFSEHEKCDNMNLLEPLTAYSPTIAVSGLAFYNSEMFPQWKGDLLLASLKAGLLYHINLDDTGNAINDDVVIDNTYGRLRDIEVAPDGSIYIAVSNQDGRGVEPFNKELDRIIRWSMQ